MEELKISEYFALCKQFDQDPSSQNEELLKNFLSELVVKDYMPLKNKMIHMVKILSLISDKNDAPGAAGILEMGKIHYGLLSYVVNLQDDVNVLGTTYDAYDMYHIYGLVDLILDVCNEDFKRFEDMLNQTVNFSNIYKLTETAALLNGDEYDKWADMLTTIKTDITPELIESLLAISSMNGEQPIDELNRELTASALREADEHLANEEKKAQKIQEAINQ